MCLQAVGFLLDVFIGILMDCKGSHSSHTQDRTSQEGGHG